MTFAARSTFDVSSSTTVGMIGAVVALSAGLESM